MPIKINRDKNITGKQVKNFPRGYFIIVSLLLIYESESKRSFIDGLPPVNIHTEIDNNKSISRSSTVEEEEAVDDDDGKLHVVISHCKLSIGWIWKSYLYNQSYESVTIISKCGVPIRPEDMPPITLTHHQQDQDQEQNDKILVQIISLPNIGRCDHSYAYWIAMVLGNEEKSMKDDYQLLYSNRDQNKSNNNSNNSSSNNSSSSSNNIINPFQSITIDPKDYIIFMKDNGNKYSYFEEISLQNMFVEMNTNNVGMACASVLNNFPTYRYSMTSWAHRGVMWNQVQMGEYRANKYKNKIIVDFQASHKPMGEWIRYLSVYNENDNNKYNHNSSNKSSYYNSSDDDDHHHQQVFSDKYLENISRSMQKIPNKDSKSYDELDLVPVCFGGRFMTRWGQLSFDDAPIENWSTITKGLGRGDNIEEGHYMERWWADILSWSSYSSRLLDTITDTTEISDDNAKTATAATTTTNTNDISGIIFKNRDHTIFYDKSRPHRRSAGEVLTQNEQRNVLSKKSYFIYKNRGFSGMIILRKNNNNTGIDNHDQLE